MAISDSASERSTSDNQARVEQAAQLAGISAAFVHAAQLGPQVLELQQSLLGGIARSQHREADRLAARHAKDDPRVARAAERARRLEELQAESGTHAQEAGRFAAASQHDGTFHGYVIQPDGTPAAAHTVLVEVGDAVSKQTRQGKTETDATGYFRIDLTGTTQPAQGLQRLIERLVRATTMADDAVAATQGAPAAVLAGGALAGTVRATGTTTAGSRVGVLDSSGRVVFEDPIPPTFDGGNSEFRYYVLPEKSTAPPAPVSRTRA